MVHPILRIRLLLLVPLAAAALLAVAGPGTAQERLPHPPIHIDNDLDFLLPGSGVIGGSGSQADPYVISGWRIIPFGPEDTAIAVEGTTKHFRIADVETDAGFRQALLLTDFATAELAGTIHSRATTVDIVVDGGNTLILDALLPMAATSGLEIKGVGEVRVHGALNLTMVPNTGTTLPRTTIDNGGSVRFDSATLVTAQKNGLRIGAFSPVQAVEIVSSQLLRTDDSDGFILDVRAARRVTIQDSHILSIVPGEPTARGTAVALADVENFWLNTTVVEGSAASVVFNGGENAFVHDTVFRACMTGFSATNVRSISIMDSSFGLCLENGVSAHMRDSTDAVGTNLTVKGSHFDKLAGSIGASGVEAVWITDNDFTFTGGIRIEAAAKATVEENRFTGPGDVRLDGDSGSFFVRNCACVVQGNAFEQGGVSVESLHGARILENTATDGGGVVVRDAQDILVRDNRFTGEIAVTDSHNVRMNRNSASKGPTGFAVRFDEVDLSRIENSTLNGGGISLNGGGLLVVRSNQIHEALKGLELMGHVRGPILFDANTIQTTTRWDGAYIELFNSPEEPVDVVMSNERILGAARNGLHVAAGHVTLDNITVESPAESGLLLGPRAEVLFKGENRIEGGCVVGSSAVVRGDDGDCQPHQTTGPAASTSSPPRDIPGPTAPVLFLVVALVMVRRRFASFGRASRRNTARAARPSPPVPPRPVRALGGLPGLRRSRPNGGKPE